MATIREYKQKNGTISYKVCIRMKGSEIHKTFFDESDAKIYIHYKERLIQNMENFEVPLKETITLEQIFDLKINSLQQIDHRQRSEHKCSLERFLQLFKGKMFYHEISLNDWIVAADKYLEFDIKRGGPNGKTIKPSLKTLRKLFAYASSCISYAISQGIDIPNNALIVMQSKINPKIEK